LESNARSKRGRQSDMQSIDDKYKQANKVLLDLRALFEQLEEAGENCSMGLQSQLSSNVNTLSRLTMELEDMVQTQNIARKDVWKMYVYSMRS